MTMAPIGLVPLILMLITRTTSISVAPSPTHPSTSLVGSASLCVVLLITRSGAIYLENASLRGMGDSDFYWYNTAYFDRSIAYFIHFTNVNIFLSNYYTHWYGFNLRCLAI